MDQKSNIVGMGCFAKTDTLRRVFRKALENFILGKYEDICPPPDRIFDDENLTCFFRSVIALGAGKPDQADRSSEFVSGSVKITGFFLGLKKRSLHLVVFFTGEGHRQTKFTARLEKYSRLREKRLH
ncbi:MAG: hypothetical protein PVF26_18875 [Desulfobacterales bacterium]|jgi:hypothetical protein